MGLAMYVHVRLLANKSIFLHPNTLLQYQTRAFAGLSSAAFKCVQKKKTMFTYNWRCFACCKVLKHYLVFIRRFLTNGSAGLICLLAPLTRHSS